MQTAFIAGATSKSLLFRAFVASTGLPKTDLVYNTSGLTCTYFTLNTLASGTVTLATLATATTAYSSGGFVHIAGGLYRFDPPNAQLSAGDYTAFVFYGVTDCVIVPDNSGVDLLGVDPRSASAVTANVTQWNSTNVATPDTAGYPKITVKSGSGAGELDITSGVVKSNLAQILGTALTETAGQIAAGFRQFFNIASPTSTMNTITTVTTATNLTNAPTSGDLTATMKTSVKTQITDALNSDTYAEPAAVPGATATLAAKINFIAAKARNKITQTSTTQLLRNDADAATIGTSTVSDDGTTFTRGKFV